MKIFTWFNLDHVFDSKIKICIITSFFFPLSITLFFWWNKFNITKKKGCNLTSLFKFSYWSHMVSTHDMVYLSNQLIKPKFIYQKLIQYLINDTSIFNETSITCFVEGLLTTKNLCNASSIYIHVYIFYQLVFGWCLFWRWSRLVLFCFNNT